ncbi:MAG: hypothetical protein KA248_09495 [Kiritimatiellae bacterium]|nr:hypothetical protein [Kiritimatiellia bacterium]
MLCGTAGPVRAQTSAYSEVNIAGSFNGWNTTTHKLTLIANNTWQGDFTLTNRSFQMKFATPAWAHDWGEINAPNTNLPISGTAEYKVNPGDISVTNAALAVVRYCAGRRSATAGTRCGGAAT